ncbi:MAG: pentapeptide repeat-containing protein [Thermodesulfobacteriota bacterium]
MSGCKSWMKYSWDGAYCENPPLEGDPEGLCILHSLKPEKDKAAFDQALQDKLAREDYDFRKVFFPGTISFIGQKFKKPVNFQGVRFTGWANFREAEFSDTADFSSAKFGQAAIFEKTRFSGQALFKNTEIMGEADFRGATFDSRAVFHQVNEARGTSGGSAFSALFQYLNFGPWGLLRFQDFSLARVSFLGTDLRRCEFHNVHWHSYRGRQVVHDEMLLREKGESALVGFAPAFEHRLDYEGLCAGIEELYRYLKLNFEKEGDQKQAGDFHYGEMEMHRRANPWRRWFPLSWSNLYWALSGYGERPLRALSWLLGLIGAMAWALSNMGLKTHAGMGTGFGPAVVFLLQQATLIRPEWAEPVTLGGQMIGALSRLLIPAQLALFLLALHSRLGRRR